MNPVNLGILTNDASREIQPFLLAFLKTDKVLKLRTPRSVGRAKKVDYKIQMLQKLYNEKRYGEYSLKFFLIYLAIRLYTYLLLNATELFL